MIAERDQIRPIMKGITAFADALDRATPGDFAMFDLTFNVIPALPDGLGNVPIPPEAATLLEGDLGELLTGLQETLTDMLGPDGLLSQLFRRPRRRCALMTRRIDRRNTRLAEVVLFGSRCSACSIWVTR